MFLAHTQGDQPELLEEDAVLPPDGGNRNQVLDFKPWTGPTVSSWEQPHSGEEHAGNRPGPAQVLTERFPVRMNTQRSSGIGAA